MRAKISMISCAAVVIIVLGIAIGSVWIPPLEVFHILIHKINGRELPDGIDPASVSIVWNLRLPRILLAFITGGALSVSGAIMQSVLRNPLASSYTIGASSGASLGAALIILYGITFPFLPMLTLPITGFVFGLGTILLAISFANRLDGQMQNHTIILTGMVFSLFINAITTLMSALQKEHMQRLIYWQMGSFSMKGWSAVWILAIITIPGILFVTHYHDELDMMTFGENQAQTMGINIKRTKRILLIASSVLTGSVISFVGVVGFVDLVAPHIVRKIFGSSHRYVIPMSALFGGAFMVLCDFVARTVVSPSELPVGAVTALIGAPFFAYIYYFSGNRSNGFRKRK